MALAHKIIPRGVCPYIYVKTIVEVEPTRQEVCKQWQQGRRRGASRRLQVVPRVLPLHRYCNESSPDYVGVYLYLLSKAAEARAHYDFRLVDQTAGSSSSIYCLMTPHVFSTIITNEDNRGPVKFMKRSELESSVYLQDDRLIIECDVTVFKEETQLVS